MSKANPYMNLYRNNLTPVDVSASKSYLFDLAVNLGQVHNLLGVMISDVVKCMGNMSLKQEENNQLHFKQNNDKSKDLGDQQIKLANNKISMKQHKQKNQIKSNRSIPSIPQKMQIQNLPIDQFNDQIKSEQYIKKEFVFNDFEFNQSKQTKPFKNQPLKNKIFIDLIEISENETIKQKKQEDLQFSKTISKEKVRYCQKYENQFKREQVNNYHQKVQAEQEINYKVKIKEEVKKEEVKKRTKSPFFDLFDSSQTNSNPQQDQDILQKFSPISQDKPFNDRLFQQTQMNQKPTSSNFLKPKLEDYSSQIKNDKISQPLNKHAKPYNLLEETFLVSSPKSNLIQVEEIDDLQSSYKKVSGKIKIQRKQRETIKENQSFDEYIPRREEIGRKKSNRLTVKGSQCPDCKAFYEAISDDSKSFKDMCECTSRHKSSTTFMKKHQVQNYSQAFSLD